MLTTTTLPTRELDHRHTDGVDVRLLWNSHTNEVSVTVEDGRTGETFVLPVEGAHAREAFAHPFAYASLGPAIIAA
ncbi:MAG: hypothetical protein ACLP4R_26580 [Solirubrobacteraceae bacterium]|jgi:hypothetical protein